MAKPEVSKVMAPIKLASDEDELRMLALSVEYKEVEALLIVVFKADCKFVISIANDEEALVIFPVMVSVLVVIKPASNA